MGTYILTTRFRYMCTLLELYSSAARVQFYSYTLKLHMYSFIATCCSYVCSVLLLQNSIIVFVILVWNFCLQAMGKTGGAQNLIANI